MNTPSSSAVSECEMANAILIAWAFYGTAYEPDPSIKDSLLMAALSSLERATNLIKTELSNS